MNKELEDLKDLTEKMNNKKCTEEVLNDINLKIDLLMRDVGFILAHFDSQFNK